MGYHQAGFDVVGVDINPQPHYPFEFVQADVATLVTQGMGRIDAIHASPPCQDHMRTPHKKHGTGWLLDHTRQSMIATGLPWVLENVAGADMRVDYALCGCQFGLLHLRRERWFETSWSPAPEMRMSHDHSKPAISVVGNGTPSWVKQKLGRNPTIAEYRAVMGIDWMNRDELSQAIPPAYTEHIGRDLLAHLEAVAA